MYYIVYNDSRAVTSGVSVHSKSGKLPLNIISPCTHLHCSHKNPNIIFIKNLGETIYNVHFYVHEYLLSHYQFMFSVEYITNGVSHIEKCQQVTLSTHMWIPGVFQLADRKNKKKYDFLSTRLKSWIVCTDSPIFFKSSYWQSWIGIYLDHVVKWPRNE